MKGLREIVLIDELKRQGLTITAIARKVGCDRKTVRRHPERGLEPPVYKPRAPVERILAPYETYPRERVETYPDRRARPETPFRAPLTAPHPLPTAQSGYPRGGWEGVRGGERPRTSPDGEFRVRLSRAGGFCAKSATGGTPAATPRSPTSCARCVRSRGSPSSGAPRPRPDARHRWTSRSSRSRSRMSRARCARSGCSRWSSGTRAGSGAGSAPPRICRPCSAAVSPPSRRSAARPPRSSMIG